MPPMAHRASSRNPFARGIAFGVLIAILSGCTLPPSGDGSDFIADPLPSWRDTPTRQAIVDFVERVSTEGSSDWIPPEERIATFDNDGTLWCERPVYFQLYFALDRIRQLAPEHPEWKEEEPFASVLRGDLEGALAGGEEALLAMILATHSGTTTEAFRDEASAWLAEARHPDTGRRFTEMTYAPMQELLDYLRARDWKVFIVSGGGIDFLRVFAEDVYGIPVERVVGSSIETAYRPGEAASGVAPFIERLASIGFIDDKAGKPVAIHRHIGRRPALAVGNSDGDFEMLEWATAGSGPRLGVLVRHTDAEREYAYDRESHVGRLDRGLDEAADRGWLVVDMAADWKRVFGVVR